MNKPVNGATTSVVGGEAAAIIACGTRISWGCSGLIREYQV